MVGHSTEYQITGYDITDQWLLQYYISFDINDANYQCIGYKPNQFELRRAFT